MATKASSIPIICAFISLNASEYRFPSTHKIPQQRSMQHAHLINSNLQALRRSPPRRKCPSQHRPRRINILLQLLRIHTRTIPMPQRPRQKLLHVLLLDLIQTPVPKPAADISLRVRDRLDTPLVQHPSLLAREVRGVFCGLLQEFLEREENEEVEEAF